MEINEFNMLYESLIEQINEENEEKKIKKINFRRRYIIFLFIIAIISYLWMKNILISIVAMLVTAFLFNPVMLYDLICHPNIKTPKELKGFEEIYSKYTLNNIIEKNEKIKNKRLNEIAINLILNTINSNNELLSMEGINSKKYEEAEFTPVKSGFESDIYIQNKKDKMEISLICNCDSHSHPHPYIAAYCYDAGTFFKIDIPYNFKEKICIINKNTDDRLNMALTFSTYVNKELNADSMLIKKNRRKSQCKSEHIKNSIFNIYSSNIEYAETFMNSEKISQLEKYYKISPFKITLKENHIYIIFENIGLSKYLLNKKYEKDEINILYSEFILAFGLANSIKELFKQN